MRFQPSCGILAVLALVGCGGSSSRSGTGLISLSKIAGNYAGTFATSQSKRNGSGVATVTITSSGAFTCKAINTDVADLGGGATITGTIQTTGQFTGTYTSADGSSTGSLVGALKPTGTNQLSFTGSGSPSNGGSSQSVSFTLAIDSVSPTSVAGTYTGTYSSVSQGSSDSGTITETISANGAISGTATSSNAANGTTSITGTLSTGGSFSGNYAPSSGSSGSFVGVITQPSWNTLTGSFAAVPSGSQGSASSITVNLTKS